MQYKKVYGSQKRKVLALGLAAFFVPLIASCGGESSGGGEASGAMESSTTQSSGMSDSMMMESTMMETTGVVSEAEIGGDEAANMSPARGIEKAESQPLPEDPPDGVQLYAATTNELVDGEIDYPRSPATNGDHNQFWQNCGFYDEPIMEEKAVHSLDHGVVWITYQPDLPQAEIDALRETYGTEPYVVVSPYEEQDSPVVATSWRVQLDLDSADDPRLSQFVDDFRVSEIAPLSGNGCVGGSGDPVVSGPESYYEEG